MALPIGPYQGQDLTNYEAGNKFLPREFYSLNSTLPSPIQTNTIGNTGGITGTQAAGSYMGYPSYEAWLLAQGGGGNGGGNDPVDNINRGGINQNLGPTNITDYESEAYGVGPTWGGTWARAKDLYSRLPTPGNLLMRGIRKWRENREIKKEQQRIAEDRTGIGEHDRGTFTGDHPDAPTKTPEQGGWHPGVGGADSGSGSGNIGSDTPSGHAGDWGPGAAQGGRIGFKDGLSAYQLFKLKELGYGNAGSNPASYGGLGVLRDILKLHKYKDGGRIGYRNGEFVEDINVEGPGFDVNENMEMAEGPSPFELRVQELVDTGMSWQEAYTIAEEEFGLTAEGPEESFSEEGIASIV